MTTREIEGVSSEDGEFVELRQHIKDGNWKGDQHKQYIQVCGELCVIGKLILRGTRIVIPSKLRPRVLSLAHEGHPGIVSMKQRLRFEVWDRQGNREVLQNLSWLLACKQSSKLRANQVNPITK